MHHRAAGCRLAGCRMAECGQPGIAYLAGANESRSVTVRFSTGLSGVWS